jgi:hypothetical protein
MPSFYTYLIASLPVLNFGSKVPFSYADFLGRVAKFIPEEDFALLEGLPDYSADNYRGGNPLLEKWFYAEITLRNELVRIRASRRHIDPHKYLRPHDGYVSHWVNRIILAAQRNPSCLEGEKILDELRWQVLEELSLGHFFDLDFLIIYGLKLLILERWDKISQANSQRLLAEELTKVSS